MMPCRTVTGRRQRSRPLSELLKPSDRDDLALALELARAVCAAVGLPGPDQDKDLVELGRALRAGNLASGLATAAHEVFALRQGVVARNLGLAYHLAKAVHAKELLYELEDLRQFAAGELCKAVARFRPDKSTGTGYLSFVVYKATARHARRHRPREVQYSARVIDHLYSSNGCTADAPGFGDQPRVRVRPRRA
jgi:hypothetical protein